MYLQKLSNHVGEKKHTKEPNSLKLTWKVATLKSQAVCCKLVHVSITVLHMFYAEARRQTSTLNVCGCFLL